MRVEYPQFPFFLTRREQWLYALVLEHEQLQDIYSGADR